MAIKSIALNGYAERGAVVAIALLGVLLVYAVAKFCLADTVATNAISKEMAEVAVGLAPSNPTAHYVLGAFNERSFLPTDFDKTLPAYETATSLSPSDYRLWFEVGKARDRAGDQAGAEKAYRKALELAPNYSRLHWAIGNLLLRRGMTEEAFVEIRRAVENDPAFSAPAVNVAWQFFGGDVAVISQKIGDSNAIKSALSTFLAKQARFDESFALWNSLSDQEKKTTYKTDGENLFQALMAAKKFRDAVSVQKQIGAGETVELEKITNPGFETEVNPANTNSFFWTIADGLQPQIGFDDKQKHGGNRSLVKVFNSPSGQEFRIVQQSIAVQGNKTYNFEIYARADLKTSATVKWEIVNLSDNKILAATAAVPNNTDWTPLAAQFTTPPDAQAVSIRLVRAACPNTLCPISGRVWFDDSNLK